MTRSEFRARTPAEQKPLLHAGLEWWLRLGNFPMHPADMGRAVELFKRLRDEAGIVFSADDVAEWGVNVRGWPPDLAEELASIARKVLAGKKVMVGDKGHHGQYWPKDFMNQLEQRARRE